MASGINKVTLVSNLGAILRLKKPPAATLCRFSLATSEQWTDKSSGQQQGAQSGTASNAGGIG